MKLVRCRDAAVCCWWELFADHTSAGDMFEAGELLGGVACCRESYLKSTPVQGRVMYV